MILQSTPLLFVNSVEESEAFFARIGFSRTVEVPHGDLLGFIIMSQGEAGGDGGIGIMLETPEAARADLPDADPELFRTGGSHLFMSVADIDAATRALDGFPTFFPRRTSFYGAEEIGFIEPGGNYVTIAQFAANASDEA